MFVPVVDEDGEVTGVMDQMTADFLASAEPDPTQATLDEAFEGVTRVRLLGGRHEPCTEQIDGERCEANQLIIDVLLLDVTDPASLTELAVLASLESIGCQFAYPQFPCGLSQFLIGPRHKAGISRLRFVARIWHRADCPASVSRVGLLLGRVVRGR